MRLKMKLRMKLTRKKISLKIFILFFLMLPLLQLHAFVDIRPSFSFYGGGAFCIPTSSYLEEYPASKEVKMPTFRTSGSFGLDLKALEFNAGDENGSFSIGAGLSYINISKSISYGASQLRPYSGFGIFLEFGILSDPFSLTLLLRHLYCQFPTVKQAFVVYDIETLQSFRLVSFGACNLYIIVPITLSVKSDATTVRLSCGLKIDYSMKKAIERGRQGK